MLRRRGFLTYLLLGAMVVVGILVFALQNYARQQNRFAHRIGYGQVCESAARSGLTVLSTRFRETFRRSGKLLPLLAALGNTRFAFFIESRPEQINQRFAALGSSSDQIFRALLGPDYRIPLDEMVERYPGMQVDLAIEVRGEPLYPATGVTDPVEKTVTMTLTAKATWMEVTRRVATGFEVKVVHPAPPLTSKFTLFTPEPANNWNTVVNNANGELLADSTEIAILINTPGEDVTDRLDDRSLIAAEADAETVRAALTNRGQIYLGGPGPISLNLTAGRENHGQFYHLYKPASFQEKQLWSKLFAPPRFFNPYLGKAFARERRYDNATATHDQYPNLQQTYYGFDVTLRGDPLFGESMVDEARSASLHLFGRASAPSRTIVRGDVHQALARVGRIGFEADSKTDPVVTTQAPPKRDQPGWRDVPYLPYCPDAEAYRADLATEESGGKPRYLTFMEGQFGAGAPGVPAEFRVQPAVYRHRSMFGDAFVQRDADGRETGYSAYMAKVERYPFAEIVDAMQYPTFFPPHTGTMPSVLESPYAAYADVKAVELPFTDSLHRQLGQQQYYKGDLAAFFTKPTPDEPSPAEAILRARTLREFATQEDFFGACQSLESPNILELWEPVRILQGGLDLRGRTIRGMGHVVVDDGVVFSGGLPLDVPPPPRPDGLPSLITIATLKGNIELAGGARHDAYFMALDGTVKVTGPGGADVVGGIAAKRCDPSSIGSGLQVIFASHGDPTRTDDPQRPRFTDYYTVGIGQVPVSVERLP